jgi:DNA polymerase I-like protein with 3'-5' exonuclease and polymerase domains
MLAIDTETTGLWFKHGSRVFSIGAYDGDNYFSQQVEVNPLTRQPTQSFSRKKWREIIFDADGIVMFHAQFDSAALYHANIITEEELLSQEWWGRVIEVDHMSHLWDSKQIRSNLKLLARKILGTDYKEQVDLDELVKDCREYCRFRWPEALIANKSKRHPSLQPASGGWHHMDMWLPAALKKHQPLHALQDWFKRSDIERMDTVLAEYQKADCVNTHRVAAALMHELLETHGDSLEEKLSMNHLSQRAICRMQHRGVAIDMGRLQTAISDCDEQLCGLTTEMKEHIPDIVGRMPTDTQVRDLLYEQWELPIIAMTDGGQSGKNKKPSVAADTLLKLRQTVADGSTEHKFLGTMLAAKKYDKKLSTFKSYRDKALNGRLFPSYKGTGTDTTRMASADPNGQNIEKAPNPYKDDIEIEQLLEKSPPTRALFGPRRGRKWVCVDYSQLQLRIFAYAVGDQDLINKFEAGWDGHDLTAHKIFDLHPDERPTEAQRRIGKNVNFGFIFGAQPAKIEATAGMPGLWDMVVEMFPLAHQFIQETKELIRRQGYVETMGGYPLQIPLARDRWTGKLKPKAYIGVNYIVQGTEGEIVKLAMRECDAFLAEHYPEGFITLQVHDEFIFDLPEDCPDEVIIILCRIMENAAKHYGVIAPVDPEVTYTTWKNKQAFKSDRIRKTTSISYGTYTVGC